MKLATLALVSAAALASISSIASAVPSFGSVSPTKSNGDFIPGSGIPGSDFTIDTALTGESVALKANDRVSGAVSRIGNVYTVPQGQSSANRAAWNFEFQFSPGANSTASSNAYTYRIDADTNPAVGLTSYQTFMVPADNSTPSLPAGDSYFTNPGTWSNAAPFVIANSENYNFGFLAGSGFTNTGPAQYQINFTAINAAGLPVASTSILVNVVPEPTTLAAVASTGLVALRRRRRA